MKILICSKTAAIRESLNLILSDIYDLILTESIEMCAEILNNAKDVNLVIGEDIVPIRDQFPQRKTLGIKDRNEVEAPFIEKPFKSDLVLKKIEEILK
ncbi:MAG: hypothetical protein A2Y03_06655 [Omnitrophica WOR_2 bacterium GWF2_38_59]|nr:MAG: hypothetical protein A2Y03_06655 [Omnitrophica WOR_2 bacterium GWF2_38_59]OGX50469.1 MAG: hypothetical protein A2243_01920 [Omnitrophica WOR_2 bacterium RIFOXYA2_FULL_38_17]OGX54539.1 MAG: hypothetical protein A2267_04600 [Omnitrophica WOR_2 bacterium RIFOXYA12_FULL_38_10]OGX59478.1 MAG: hypothetical protein A2306_09545 [Omnitrophica WOR_2 bacterium RIFOXYB2_FULL_38_16]HBG62056.1 hypothetical protein [Candidatus Omnitrophota bacterium]